MWSCFRRDNREDADICDESPGNKGSHECDLWWLRPLWCLSSFSHTTEMGEPYFVLKFLERNTNTHTHTHTHKFEKANTMLSMLQWVSLVGQWMGTSYPIFRVTSNVRGNIHSCSSASSSLSSLGSQPAWEKESFCFTFPHAGRDACLSRPRLVMV